MNASERKNSMCLLCSSSVPFSKLARLMCREETMFRGSYLLEGKMSRAIDLKLKLLHRFKRNSYLGVFTESLCPKTEDMKIKIPQCGF